MKRFLQDPDRGRPRQQLLSPVQEKNGFPGTIFGLGQSYIELERQANDAVGFSSVVQSSKMGSKSQEPGKTVDIVLSDMSAPWEQTAGFWKRSLSDPYIRMTNTTGIRFKDHAASMVSSQPVLHNLQS